MRSVIVVGGGMVGLSCAWALQEHGLEVTVVDRRHPGAGSSWGNAGLVSPALTVPLPEPSMLRYAARALVDPRAPVALSMPPSLGALRFLARMARHCTSSRWRRTLDLYRPLNARIFEAFDRQQAGGVDAALRTVDLIAAFRSLAEAQALYAELQAVRGPGLAVELELLTGDEARVAEPHLSYEIGFAILVRAQRFITPSAYVSALAEQVRARGAPIELDTPVTDVRREGERVVAVTRGRRLDADAVVLAAGSWLAPLARPHGVRAPIQAGRGYSFTAPCHTPLRRPLYLPATRVAVTPDGDRARLAGIMEFGPADAAPVRGRIPAIVRAVRPLLDAVDLDDRRDEWVGARPLTADGIPLVGATRTPGVYVAGGHGMWGVTLGPLTGELLAERVVTGQTPALLAPLDPLR